MAKTDAIERFLREQYSDEKLEMLKKHCESGKLSFFSCCCFIGVVTADHANGQLKSRKEYYSHENKPEDGGGRTHYAEAKRLTDAVAAEAEVLDLSFAYGTLADEERRNALLPLIVAEQQRRVGLKLEKEQGK